jgi:hypothetical protein
MFDAGCLTALELRAFVPLRHVRNCCIWSEVRETSRLADQVSHNDGSNFNCRYTAAVQFGERATDRFDRSATRVKANDSTAESLTKWITITTLFTLLSTWLFLRRNNSRAVFGAQELSTRRCAQWCDCSYPATSSLTFMPLSFQRTGAAHIYF